MSSRSRIQYAADVTGTGVGRILLYVNLRTNTTMIYNQDVAPCDARHSCRASGKSTLPTSFLLFALLYSCITRHDCYHFLYARPRMLYDTKPTPPLTISCTKTHARGAAASRRPVFTHRIDLVVVIVCKPSKYRHCAVFLGLHQDYG
jgi:hypothetical protein